MHERKEFNSLSCYRAFWNGDTSAVERLVREYSDGLIRFAYCYVKNATVAEEIMEDAFTALIVKRRSFDTAENLRAYLYKAVRNKCVDYLRFRKKRVPIEDLDGELVADESENAETSLLRNENKKAVYQALQSLPPQYREVLYLTYYEDYTAEDLARILRKTKKQIYNLLHRAKNSLKELLVKEGISHENL